ncbi:MAG: phosphatidylglycerophosphatase A [Candidatus Aceula meridiana]|nr:phosphatidylglycerophosphatase A [Candidatus Aceula meridiana]
MNYFVKIITTFFFIGYIPVMPGSMASIAGALIAISLSDSIGFYILAWAAVTFFGFLTSGKMEKILGCKDPGCVVIDEVSGIMIAFFMLPEKFSVWITAFFLFRAFDMFKIYPANFFEKKKGSAGIMLDDVAAGIYANIIMHIAIRVINFV